jgi:catechol 2,3-dioxygenase-like lactoylglutathione lyase family enzyme
MKIEFKRIDHVQICIPRGEETKAREFYCGILGLKEIPKPEPIRANGGFWLEAGNVQLHIGVEEIQGKSKRHPAFEVNDIDRVREYLTAKGVKMREEVNIPGINRFSIFDYWDNRMELLESE